MRGLTVMRAGRGGARPRCPKCHQALRLPSIITAVCAGGRSGGESDALNRKLSQMAVSPVCDVNQPGPAHSS
jgi:hypothetical protein